MGKARRENILKVVKHQERGVTPAHAIATLKKEGIEVNEEQAEVILDFLYILAKLAVNQYFNEV